MKILPSNALRTILTSIIGLTLLTSVVGAGCANSPTPPLATPDSTTPPLNQDTIKTGYKLYTNGEKKFSIQYPEKWTVNENVSIPGSETKLDVQITAPAIKGVTANLNIVSQSYPGSSEYTVDSFKDSFIKGYKDRIPNFNLIEAKKVSLSGEPALMVTYTGTINQIKGYLTQYLILKQDQVYFVTITHPQDDPKSFEDEFSSMVQTFKISN